MSVESIALTAAWIWCGPGELRSGGWVVIEGGRIREISSRPPGGIPTQDLGQGLLMPGLVNAHTHLELSFLAGQNPPAGDFMDWVTSLVNSRPGYDRVDAKDAALKAAESAAGLGTVLAGDISNTGKAAWAWQEAGVSALTLIEAVGPARSQPPAPEAQWQGRMLGARAIAAHAPYSVPGWRLKELKQQAGETIFCIHLAESRAEVEFFAGKGNEGRRMEEFLNERGMVRDELGITAEAPLAHLMNLGVVDANTLLVHGVQLSAEEISQVAEARASVCICPRSNLGLTRQVADVPALIEAGVNLALGTDSLVSAPDLDILAEMKTLYQRYPKLDPEVILTMSTVGGAKALGLGDHFGSIRPGMLGPLVFLSLENMAGKEVLEAVVDGEFVQKPQRVG